MAERTEGLRPFHETIYGGLAEIVARGVAAGSVTEDEVLEMLDANPPLEAAAYNLAANGGRVL